MSGALLRQRSFVMFDIEKQRAILLFFTKTVEIRLAFSTCFCCFTALIRNQASL